MQLYYKQSKELSFKASTKPLKRQTVLVQKPKRKRPSKKMQSLLSLRLRHASSKFTNTSNPSLVLSHPYKTFTSLTKPTPQHYQGRIFSSPVNPIHHFHSSCPSLHTLSAKIHGFLSSPLLSKQFLSTLSNTHFRVSSRSLTNCKVGPFRASSSGAYPRAKPSVGSYERGWKSRLTPDNVVFGLTMANIAVFTLWRIADQEFMMKNFMISLENFKSGRIHTLITSAFSHIDTGHFVSDLIVLFFFGTSISKAFGPEFLLKLYLAGAIAGSVLYLVHHAFMARTLKELYDSSRAPSSVASGSVSATVLLYIFLRPRATIYVNFFIPVPAFLLGVFYIGKDMLKILEGKSNISGSAHLAGAAVAAIAFARIRQGRF